VPMAAADRARRNVEVLISDFDGYVRRFEASNVFTGPSRYFHQRGTGAPG